MLEPFHVHSAPSQQFVRILIFHFNLKPQQCTVGSINSRAYYTGECFINPNYRQLSSSLLISMVLPIWQVQPFYTDFNTYYALRTVFECTVQCASSIQIQSVHVMFHWPVRLCLSESSLFKFFLCSSQYSLSRSFNFDVCVFFNFCSPEHQHHTLQAYLWSEDRKISVSIATVPSSSYFCPCFMFEFGYISSDRYIPHKEKEKKAKRWQFPFHVMPLCIWTSTRIHKLWTKC